jgi:N-acetylglucosamine malate deacetylase 1
MPEQERPVRRVLVVSPHPDDESIGCGGTMHRHTSEGASVRAVFLTSGERGGHGRPAAETARLREREAETAAAILGLARIEFWREPDGALRARQLVVDRLRRIVETWAPDVVYVTHDQEMHPDHRAAARIARFAMDASPGDRPAPALLGFEVWTPLQRIDTIVDISDHIDAKAAAIRAHATQCHVMRFDEAALALSRYRGEMHSWPGGDYAEIFRKYPTSTNGDRSVNANC